MLMILVIALKERVSVSLMMVGAPAAAETAAIPEPHVLPEHDQINVLEEGNACARLPKGLAASMHHCQRYAAVSNF